MTDHIRYTREEMEQKYKDAQKEMQLTLFKKLLLPGFAVGAVFFLIAGIVMLLGRDGKMGQAVGITLGVVGLLAVIGFMVWFFKTLFKITKLAKAVHPACPACGESINFNARRTLLKTSACPFCKEVIIEG